MPAVKSELSYGQERREAFGHARLPEPPVGYDQCETCGCLIDPFGSLRERRIHRSGACR